MPASKFVGEVDAIQKTVAGNLAQVGFRVRGRTYNRLTSDGLTHVINFQMGASDPPGITYFPGLRENFHGLFTINLGVYVPEVAEFHGGGLAKSWVQEYYCSIRDRLGPLSGNKKDLWWAAQAKQDVISDIRERLLSFGVTFLDRFLNRDALLHELDGHTDSYPHCTTPRIVCAIILAKRGCSSAARNLLAAQASGTQVNRHHPTYVRELAQRLGLGEI